MEGKDDSHMIKHWRLSHPDLQEPPKFNIMVVASFQDAMSRQLSEAVRIDLRGENVLNSKSEYSKCKLVSYFYFLQALSYTTFVSAEDGTIIQY